jgi:DNA-binding CsgD family transcriptional regulator
VYQRSLAISRDTGDQAVQALALNGLGVLACATGDYAAAGHHLAEGLQLVIETRFVRLILAFLASVGDWLIQTGRPAEAAESLALAGDHPASDHETRARARHLLAPVAPILPPGAYAAAVERGRGADPADLALRLVPMLTEPLAVLPAPIAQPAETEAAARGRAAIAPSIPMSILPEPLTARELAVLRLIAAGRSNREIADELFLAVNTVRSYSQHLYGKLGVGSRTQAIARARELDLLP